MKRVCLMSNGCQRCVHCVCVCTVEGVCVVSCVYVGGVCTVKCVFYVWCVSV